MKITNLHLVLTAGKIVINRYTQSKYTTCIDNKKNYSRNTAKYVSFSLQKTKYHYN